MTIQDDVGATAVVHDFSSGLAAWYPGAGNAVDQTGQNNATLVNGVTFASGVVGQAFSLNGGQNQYVQLPNNLFPFPTSGNTGATPFSFSTWFQTTRAGGVILGQQDADASSAPLGWVPAIYLEANGLLRVQMFYATVGVDQAVSSVPVNDGQFHQLVVTYDGVKEQVYLDGVPIGAPQTITQLGYAATYHYQLGSGYTYQWPGDMAGLSPDPYTSKIPNAFTGLIDEPAVFTSVLSATAVQASYNAGQAGQNPMVAVAPNLAVTVVPVVARAFVPFSGVVATFTDANVQHQIGGYLATIQWGDGNSSMGVISGSAAGGYTVSGAHTYTNTLLAAVAVTVVYTPPFTGPTDGLVSSWGTNGTAEDSVGDNDGVLNGPITFAAGVVGEGFQMDQVNQFDEFDPVADDSYVQVPNNPTINLSNQLTIAAWIDPGAAGGQLIDSWQGGHGFDLGIDIDTETLYFVRGSEEQTTTVMVPTGWSFVAATYDGSFCRIYLNGQLIGEAPVDGSFDALTPSTSPLVIGAAPALSTSPYFETGFTGQINDVLLYNTPLDAAQIQEIYQAGIPAATTPQDVARASGTATVQSLVVTTVPITAIVGSPFSGAVAAFTDTNPQDLANGYLATIQWGDGSYSAGVISGSAVAGYTVTGAHTYTTSGSFTDAVTVSVNTPPNTVPTQGLVSSWGTTAAAEDSVGNNNGTLQGPVAYAPGVVGEGFGFNGNDSVQVSDNPTLDITNQLSIAAWIYPTANGGEIVNKYDGTNGYAFGIDASAGQTLFLELGGDTYRGVTHLPLNTWNFVAATFDGSVARLYINGEYDAQSSAVGGNSTIPTNSGPLTIGADQNGQNGFTGQINAVLLYNTLVGTVQLQGIYQAEVGAITHPTAAVDSNTVRVVARLLATGISFTAIDSTTFSGAVANFTDANPPQSVGDLTASINWGDGSNSSGAVSGSNGNFTVSGSHTYIAADFLVGASYPVTITIQDSSGASAAATATATATVIDPPVITTATVTAIAATSATLGGNVRFDGGGTILRRGVVYSQSADPALNAPGVIAVDAPAATGVFTVNVTGLTPDTIYYYNAFAVNAAGISNTLVLTPFITSFTAASQAVSTSYNQPVVIALSSDAVSGRSLTYSVASGPAHGTLSGTGPTSPTRPLPAITARTASSTRSPTTRRTW